MEGATGQNPCLLPAPGDWTTNQRIHTEGPMVLAAFVAEDGLENARAGRWEWVGEGAPS
ncbi:hypothetical protein T4A_5448 [Trichinella pseudospiralis]|uniref:Uncharacterized protein n=1 Tax=Trichinella pseudospiralis TaxID=6337 RepID=A0A0V1D151_TRIPS|nr:hypothetical protein T4A_5448 [Trichinella pseudospiralis]